MPGTPPIDSLDAKINKIGLKVGNKVLDSAGLDTTTVSTTPYVDSSGNLAIGAVPFTLPVSGGATTSATFLKFTGASTGEANTQMTYPLVLGSNVTTFTKTGFVKVAIVDSSGNLTDGDHYIQIGTLS